MQVEELDCLLVWPPFVFPSGFYSNLRAYDPPLGLLALAAYVREYNYSVKILDCNVLFERADEEFESYFVANYVNQYQSVKVIGFTTTTPTVNASFRLAAICKKYYPNCRIIFGGAHASFIPDECLDKDFIDAVAIGEGEETLKEFLDGKAYSEIDGLAYKELENGQKAFKRTKPRKRIRTLDELPRPAYDLLDMQVYRPILGSFKRLPAMMMVTSRGCPWSCNFCRRPVGKMWTYRSAKSLYDEMKFLSETYGIKDIAIQDDVFTVNKERVFELCDLLIKNPIDIQWLCFARVDIVTEELLVKMKQAGCWHIMYGVENFNQDILNGINKGVELAQIYDAVSWSKKAGLDVRVCMIVGNVGDTEAIVERNIDLLIELDPDFISVAILTPFPGHDIYNWALKEGRISTFNWDLYFGSTPILKLDTLTPEQIVDLYRKMTFRFYFRPSFILKKLWRMRSFTELAANTKGFFSLLKFITEKMMGVFYTRKDVHNNKIDVVFTKLSTNDEKRIAELTRTATPQTSIT